MKSFFFILDILENLGRPLRGREGGGSTLTAKFNTRYICLPVMGPIFVNGIPSSGFLLKFRKISGVLFLLTGGKTRCYKLFHIIPLIVRCFLADAFSREFKNNENKNLGYFRL